MWVVGYVFIFTIWSNGNNCYAMVWDSDGCIELNIMTYDHVYSTIINEQWTMNFISNLYKLHYITQFTSIYIINIGNKVIQIGGKSIAIYSCLPTFPLEKK